MKRFKYTATTREDLEKLLQDKDRLMDMAVQMGDMKPGFAERLRSLDQRIGEAVGLQTVDLLDSLNRETIRLTNLTARLTRLTVVLIGLTIVLAILALASLI